MGKIKAYVTQSLDGYISKGNGDTQWMDDLLDSGEGDYGYFDFYVNVERIVFGRVAYESVVNAEEHWPYTDVKSFVLSNSTEFEISTPKTARLTSATIGEATKAPKGKKDTWVFGGGKLISEFLEKGIIEELQLVTLPILIGDGVRLFQNNIVSSLELMKVDSFSNGVICSNYKNLNKQSE